jgi:hypothetical protein
MTFTEKTAAYFTAHPGVWLDGRDFTTISGAYAWRSRIADCRTQLGMCIENRQRRLGKATVSEYRFTPNEFLG